MSLNRFHVVSPLALVAFSACRSPYTGGGSVGGAVINGPLNEALVFLDYDFDGVLDADEPSARTDASGKYTLVSTRTNYDLVAIADDQTVDSSSGATFSGITLKAPSGAGVISPTSTLMKEGGLTATEVAAVLGLPDDVDPLSFNPFADGVDAAKALEVAKVSKQITAALSSFASAAEGAGAGADDAFKTALNSMVEVVKTKAAKAKDANASAADKKIDFTKTNDLELIKAKVATKAATLDGIDMTTMNALANDTRDAIKNVNDVIATVTDLKSDATKNIFSNTQLLRDQVKEAAVAKKAGGVGNIAFKSRAEVDTQATNKAPQDINLTGNGTISESASSLVVGIVSTVDTDQKSGTAFKYKLAGKDADLFSLNEATGALSLKAKPDYAKKPSYEVTIITKDSGGKKYAETFKINVLKEGAEGTTPFKEAKAGELVTLKYKATDKGGSFIKDAILTFKNELGETIELKDEDNDGIASNRLDATTSNGTYVLHKIELKDAKILSNTVSYEQGTKTTTIKGVKTTQKHSLDFSKFTLKVTGGKDAKSDFTPPDLTSVTMGAATTTAGAKAYLDYKATDVGSFIKEAEFIFKNVAGQTIKFTDTDNDGKAYSDIPLNALKGDFLLHEVKLTDFNSKSNVTKYDSAGNKKVTVQDVENSSKHTIDFSTTKFEVTTGLEPQTDFTPPDLSNIAPPRSAIEVGGHGSIGYRGTEARESFIQAEFQFKNSAGDIISFYDKNGTDEASSIISKTATKGEYTLHRVLLSDANPVPNKIIYEADGSTKTSIKGIEAAGSAHNLNLGQHKITLAESSLRPETDNPEFDARAPITIDSSERSHEFGDVAVIKYSASNDVAKVSITFEGDDGAKIVFDDHNLDGTAEAYLSDNTLVSGSYAFKSATLEDFNGNSATYTDLGRIETLSLRGARDLVNSDTRKPDITKLTPEKSEANFGEIFDIAYTGDGTGSAVTKVELNFHLMFGGTIKFIDNDGDGIASALINHGTSPSGSPQKLVDGEYKFDGGSITDAGGNITNLLSRDFDTKFTLKGANKFAADTTKPTMKNVTLDKTDLDFGTIASIKYSGDGTGSDITHVSFNFQDRNNKNIEFTDHDGDGVATALLNSATSFNIVNGMLEKVENPISNGDIFILNRAYISDAGGNQTSYVSRDFDLKFSVNVPRAADQTDFEAPELDLTSFISLDEIV